MLKYPSIENYYNVFKNKYLNSFMEDVFYATEKIHGSNMRGNMRCSKGCLECVSTEVSKS